MENINISNDYKTMIKNAVQAAVDYIRENNISSLVIGISGGVDSAVTAAIAKEACSKTYGCTVIGRCMPIDGNNPDEIERAIAVGEAYCHDFRIDNLNDAFLAMMKQVDGELSYKYLNDKAGLCHAGKVRAGNIKARVRMINLYNLASKHKGLVLSTDNLTELMLGFWTLHGDVGDLGFIQKLWKTEVFGMADVLGGPAKICADAKPTDGLGVSNSDLDQILPSFEGTNYRAGYRLVDDILIDYMTDGKQFQQDIPVILRSKATEFKRLNPVSFERSYLLWKHA